MKKIVYIYIYAMFAFLQSCNQEDLLVTEPTETISTPSTEQKVNGMYALLIKTGTGGTTRHEDFGQKGIDIFMDMLESDVALSRNAYNRYASLANYSDILDYTSNNNYIPWRYYYRVIYSANDVIEDFGGSDNPDFSKGSQALFAQALAMRGYAYFYLLQLYTKEYDPSKNGVPIVTSILQTKSEMKSQKEVYDFILSDLTRAENLLNGYTRNNKIKFNQDVVRGLLAYTYAAMNNPIKAAEYSQKVIDSGYPITTSAQLTGGFNSSTTPSWIWGADLTVDMGFDLVSWWGQMDYFTYSYQSVGDYKTIDETLRLSISTDDIRKNQFQQIVTGYWFGSGKFYHPNRVRQGQRQIETDYIFMRVDEFYLLKAESLAKQGDSRLAEAKQVLKDLLRNRISDLSFIDNITSSTSLLNEIYRQTRIELWGEGKTYLAMKRNKMNVVRGQNHDAFKGLNISSTDDKLTFKIPSAEVINNPNL